MRPMSEIAERVQLSDLSRPEKNRRATEQSYFSFLASLNFAFLKASSPNNFVS